VEVVLVEVLEVVDVVVVDVEDVVEVVVDVEDVVDVVEVEVVVEVVVAPPTVYSTKSHKVETSPEPLVLEFTPIWVLSKSSAVQAVVEAPGKS